MLLNARVAVLAAKVGLVQHAFGIVAIGPASDDCTISERCAPALREMFDAFLRGLHEGRGLQLFRQWSKDVISKVSYHPHWQTCCACTEALQEILTINNQ